jgi:succinyl-diaminopimelate desuccinylase
VARPGGGFPCFAGHSECRRQRRLDVDPFAAEIIDGRLYGRGAADMKSAIAAFSAAAVRFAAKTGGDFPGAISLLITGDEEGPSVNGTKPMLQALAADGETFDACLVGEPTNPRRVGEMAKIGRRGSWTGHLTVKRRATSPIRTSPTIRPPAGAHDRGADRDAARFAPPFRAEHAPTIVSAAPPPTSSRSGKLQQPVPAGFTPASLEAEVRRRPRQVGALQLRTECWACRS